MLKLAMRWPVFALLILSRLGYGEKILSSVRPVLHAAAATAEFAVRILLPVLE